MRTVHAAYLVSQQSSFTRPSINTVHAINFYPKDVIKTHEKDALQSFATVKVMCSTSLSFTPVDYNVFLSKISIKNRIFRNIQMGSMSK